MDPKHKLILQKNHGYLKGSLDVDGVLSKLFEKCTITLDDRERVEAEVTTEDKVVKLLKILPRKPDKAYKVFLESVERHIQDQLNSTDIPEDVLEKECQDLNDVIKTVLKEHFGKDENERISFSSLEETVREEVMLYGKTYTITPEHLQHLVFETFPFSKSTFEQLKHSKKMYFMNIARIRTESSDDEKASTTEDSTDSDQQGMSSNTPKSKIENMNVEDLYRILEPVLKSNSFDLEVLEIFKKEDINGEIFESLTIDDTRQLFPKLTFGKRKKLLLLRDKILQDKINIPQKALTVQSSPLGDIKALSFRETFRKFDSTKRNTDAYKKAAILTTNITRPHNLIEPVHCFIDSENGNKKSLHKWIADKTVSFACACMNERTNGTLHFGVSPRPGVDSLEGEIVGISVDQVKCNEMIHKAIMDSFYEDQIEIIFKCIRPVEFINVISHTADDKQLVVVEVDIVPDSSLLEDDVVFVKKPKRTLFRFATNTLEPKPLSDDETHEYMKIKKRVADNRRTQENKPKTYEIQEDLRQKFLNIFTGGNDHLSDETYPILFLSPLDSTMDMDFADNFKFVKDIDPCVIFDFDSSSDGKGMYHFIDVNQEQAVKALTTDNFDKNSEENRKNHETHSHVFDDLRTSSFKPWVFCNGYDIMNKQPMDVLEWKRSRSEGFKEALRFFNDEIPKGRAKVIFLLFSKNYETMLEAAEEVLVKFSEQWVLLAENKEIANHWMTELLRRRSVDKDNISQRCVLGLPWMHVNQMIQQVMMTSKSTRCEIPCSTGAVIHLKEKLRNGLCDLEIIGVKECDINEVEPQTRMKHRRDIQEKFFRGGQVSWWNFWYGDDHVLCRTQHERIKRLVQRGINGELNSDESKVSIINLVHQPGAGGTTSARQILWDMRERNRCCVVKQITDQTCDQIVTLRKYEEPTSPLPPVVLLDNEDEENVHDFVLQLENCARIATRRSEERIKAFCVLLLCTRRTKLPLEVSLETIILKQELDQRELEWFSNKYKTLEENFQKKQGVDPRLLISFNILKENFNPDYIKRTVQQYVEGISNQQEKDLLLYLSMINTFDLNFKSIPVSAFDQLMTTSNTSKGKKVISFSYGLVSPKQRPERTKLKKWESTISSELQVLLNRSSRAGFGTNLQTLAIINPLFSREIFQCLQKQMALTTSEAMLQFLNSPVFESRNRSVKELMSVIKDIFKKREELSNGKKEKFSPLITEVLKEDPDKAADIMIEGFERTDDPMIAQQISRLYTHCKNWDKALEYAKRSTEMKPKSSYLWDTYGLVYKHMLLEKYDTYAQSGDKVSIDDAKEFVKIAVDGLDKFHREQQISEDEKGAWTNDAGYFNEIRLVIVLLDLLAFTPIEKKDLHLLLIDDHHIKNAVDVLGNDTTQHLKSLHALTETAIRKLEEKNSQLKDSAINDIFRWKYGSFQQQMLAKLRENVDFYFGEDTDIVPENLEPKEKADFRRRRVRRLGGNSLSNILSLRKNESDLDKLRAIYAHVTANITTNHCESSDLKSLIGVVIAMNMTGQTLLPFSVMIDNSRKLFDREIDTQEERPSLEPFLFLALFHWPTENKRDKNLYPIGRIKDVIRKWKTAFHRNHPRQREDGNPFRKRETTYFFLGKGPEYKEIVYYEELNDHWTGYFYKEGDVWEKPKAMKKLKRMEGILINEGMDVNMQLETKDGNKFSISIQTATPIGQRQLWQKRVYFYLGFSWAGPKAFDVSQNPREEQSSTMLLDIKKTQSDYDNSSVPTTICQNVITPSPKLVSEISIIHERLGQIKQKKEDGIDLHNVEEEEKRLTTELDSLLRKRREMLGT